MCTHRGTQRANLSDIFTGRSKLIIPPALSALCDALAAQSALVELDISDNAFGPVGVASFSDLLLRSQSLRKLRINNNGLGPEGGSMLAQVLTKVVVRSLSPTRTLSRAPFTRAFRVRLFRAHPRRGPPAPSPAPAPPRPPSPPVLRPHPSPSHPQGLNACTRHDPRTRWRRRDGSSC